MLYSGGASTRLITRSSESIRQSRKAEHVLNCPREASNLHLHCNRTSQHVQLFGSRSNNGKGRKRSAILAHWDRQLNLLHREALSMTCCTGARALRSHPLWEADASGAHRQSHCERYLLISSKSGLQ